MKLVEIFKDSNEYNEKTIVGGLSFAMMCLFAIADLVTGLFGKELAVNTEIYYSFVFITLGAFGIDQMKPRKKTEDE